jgi:hypothetical protein
VALVLKTVAINGWSSSQKLLKNTTARSCAGGGVGEGVAVGTRVAVAVAVGAAWVCVVAVDVGVAWVCVVAVDVGVAVGGGGADSTPAAPVAKAIARPSSSARQARTKKARERMPALAYTRAFV